MDYAREQWRAVGDWPYEVSSLGRVRRTEPGCHTRPGRLLRAHVTHSEYRRVLLSDTPRSQHFFVFRLVAEAFCDRPSTDMEFVPNHINGNKGDDRASNLEWVTRSENQIHAAILHEHRGEGHANAKLSTKQVREIRARYTGAWGQQTGLAEEYGVTQMLVSKIVRGEVWTHVPGNHPGTGLHSGEEHGCAKLTPRQVRAMRRRFDHGKVTMQELAETYGVGRQIVRDIVRGKTWKHVM